MMKTKRNKTEWLIRQNIRHARLLWPGELERSSLLTLKKLTSQLGLSLALGELLWLNQGWYITGGGLLRVAKENGCYGIQTRSVPKLCDAKNSRWVFRATVYTSLGSQGFVGYGDADPSNVSPLVRGAEMRVAETRAVNRALRKAYGIGLCSVEELGSLSSSSVPSMNQNQYAKPDSSNGANNGQPRLRDKLCVLIRQHSLDPSLVKAYAADYCGTETLSGASRDLVESFISHLAAAAQENRDALVRKLNSYSQPVEVRS